MSESQFLALVGIIYLTTGKDGAINCPSCLVLMPNECNDHIELVHFWNTRASDELIDKLADALKYVRNEASWHYDEDASEDDCSPSDNVAHINGLIVKKSEEALALADKWRKG